MRSELLDLIQDHKLWAMLLDPYDNWFRQARMGSQAASP